MSEEGERANSKQRRGGGGGGGGGGRGEQSVGLAEEVKVAAAKGSWEEVSAVVARAKSSGLRLDGRWVESMRYYISRAKETCLDVFWCRDGDL